MSTQIIILLIITGIAAGLMGGLVGIGGGLIIVPALIYLLGYGQHQAQGTSLALIMLPVGIFGVLQYYKAGHININVVLLLAVGFLLGSFLGSKIALSIPQATIKKVFAIFLIVIAIKMLFFEGKKQIANNKPQAQAN
jgi:uncharacterized protein